MTEIEDSHTDKIDSEVLIRAITEKIIDAANINMYMPDSIYKPLLSFHLVSLNVRSRNSINNISHTIHSTVISIDLYFISFHPLPFQSKI